MARPTKAGLDYFPLDVDVFSDKKIRVLKAKHGIDGVMIYLYLLCEIYKNGYFLKVDEDFIYLVSEDLGIKANQVRQVLHFLLERSLFDDKLFQSDKVLTSTGIQKRFQLAVKERAKKTPMEIREFWLLKKSETESFLKVLPFLNNSEKNEGNSEKNEGNSQEKSIKESKEKKRKGEESKGGKKGLTPEEKQTLNQIYGSSMVEDYIKRTTQYHCCNFETIKKWIEEDKQKKQSHSKNRFNDFPQRQYSHEDMLELERKLLRKGLHQEKDK